MTTFTKFDFGVGTYFRPTWEYSTVLIIPGSSCELSRLSVLYPYTRCFLSARSSDTLSDRFDPGPTPMYDDIPRKWTPTFLYDFPSTVSVAGTSTSVPWKSCNSCSQSAFSNWR